MSEGNHTEAFGGVNILDKHKLECLASPEIVKQTTKFCKSILDFANYPNVQSTSSKGKGTVLYVSEGDSYQKPGKCAVCKLKSVKEV